MIQPKVLHLDASKQNRQSQTRIQIRIPQKYHHQPVISCFASRRNLEFNILAAFLEKNARGDGWFDLELRGNSQEIDDALIDLTELGIEVWQQKLATETETSTLSEPNRLTQIRWYIHESHLHEPVISHLVFHYNLEVNILGNSLGGNGWFELEIRGNYQEIDSALIYLAKLDLKVWHQSISQRN